MRGAGLSHLLAVSGFHLVVLTGLLRQLLNKFRVKKRWKIPLLLALTWGYAALLGFPVSIRRAAVVFTLSLLAEAVDRQADGLTSLGVAALLIGMIDPFSAGSLSVQMTFLSSLGILLWTGPVVRFLEGRVLFFLGPRLPRVRWAVEAFGTLPVCGVGLSPLLAYHFGVVALYGPLAAVFTALLVPLHWEQRRLWPCCLWRSRWPRLWPALPLPGFYRWPTGFPPCPGRFGRRGMGLFPWFSPSLWRC